MSHAEIDIFQKQSSCVQDISKRKNPSKSAHRKFCAISIQFSYAKGESKTSSLKKVENKKKQHQSTINSGYQESQKRQLTVPQTNCLYS